MKHPNDETETVKQLLCGLDLLTSISYMVPEIRFPCSQTHAVGVHNSPCPGHDENDGNR